MSLFDLIPTSDNLMSIYTLIGLTIVASSTLAIDVIIVKWVLREFKAIKAAIDGHDAYIDSTSKTINQMSIDIAVVCSSIKNIEKDGTETRTDIAEINRTLLDRLTGK